MPSGCPYKPGAKSDNGSSTSDNNNNPTTSNASSAPSQCPVQHGQKKAQVYNVYSQEINPDNQMPSNPNQLPREDQSEPLSTARTKSTIPKGGTDSTWTYPSPQMFFNALKRKGKGEDVVESDMENVVAVHNSMNEQTWNQIQKWEAIRSASDPEESPSLHKFLGRPHDISPKAWFLSTFTSKPKPFDRHDWTVLRGEEEVRYVIDYYYMDDGEGGNTNMPVTATGAFDKGSLDERLIYVDARPALDSWSGLVARARVFLGLDTISDPWVSSEDSSKALSHSLDVDASSLDERFRPEALHKLNEWINTKCATGLQRMEAVCSKDPESDECSQAALAVRVCSGQVICPNTAEAFVDSIKDESQSEETRRALFTAMDSCLNDFAEKAAEVYAQRQARCEV